MKKTFIFSGAGGQGMLSLGVLLASLAMEQGFEATYFPSYGPEMRGGTAHCHVIIDDKAISSPRISKNIDYCIAMNQPSYEKFAPLMVKGGIMICNSNMTQETGDAISIPMNEIAVEVGGLKTMNMIAFGILNRHLAMFEQELVIAFIDDKFKEKPQFKEKNRNAFLKGWNWIDKTRGT